MKQVVVSMFARNIKSMLLVNLATHYQLWTLLGVKEAETPLRNSE